MPYPHYTKEEKRQTFLKAVDVDKCDLLHPNYWLNVSGFFQSAYPCFGNQRAESYEPFQLIISGKLRNGNGEKFPADWDGEDICCYIYEKEQARKAKNEEQRRNKKTAESLAEMGINVPEEEQPVQEEEEKEEPDFLLYDEEKKCFIELTAENFYTERTYDTDIRDYIGHTNLRKTGEIDVTMELPADADEKTVARTNALKSQLINSIVADAAAAITELVSDLQKRDSIFSANSKEYKDFYNGLKQLRNKLVDENGQPRPFNSLEELGNCFNDPENKVFDMAGTYLKTKMRQKNNLSDRQIDRMSMCRRFRSINKAVDKAITDAKDGKFADCRTEIVNATAAHKAVLGLMRSAGPAAESKAFRNDAVYMAQFERTKEVFEKKTRPFTVAAYSAKTPAAVAEALVPEKVTPMDSALTKAERREAAENLAELAKQGPNKTKMAAIAEFMMQRTTGMLEELKANDTLWHSDEQKKFRAGVEDLHDKLTGLFADTANPTKAFNTLIGNENGFKKLAKLAEAYQVRHIGDSAYKGDMKAVRRLGVAAEILICQEYLANTDPEKMEPADLFKKIKAHQDLMRELETKHDRYVNQEISTMADLSLDKTPAYQKAEKDYVKAFNQLINGAGYGKVVDAKVEAQAESLKAENNALIAIAVSKNQSLESVKEGIEKGTIPDPAKIVAAPKADDLEETNGLEELMRSHEENLIP